MDIIVISVHCGVCIALFDVGTELSNKTVEMMEQQLASHFYKMPTFQEIPFEEGPDRDDDGCRTFCMFRAPPPTPEVPNTSPNK
jgi:hypothetical protein